MLKAVAWIGGSLWVVTLLASAAWAQVGMGGRGGGGRPRGGPPDNRSSTPSSYYRGTTPPPRQAILTPHCGQYLTDGHCYELVLTMSQARIYVYDKSLNPQTARNLHAQLSLQVPGERDIRRIPFQYAPLPPGLAVQDCVVANFDFGQLGDQEVPLTIAMFDLPGRSQPTTSFTPLFTKDAIRPYVAEVALTEADRAGVLRQRVCPVSGDVLGSKGRIVKLLIGEVPLYVCSQDCLRAIRQSPQQYLPHPPLAPAAPFSPGPGGR